GQRGVDPADVAGRGEVLQAVDLAWRGPRSCLLDGRQGGPVDGAGEQRPAAGFVRGDETLREIWPVIELEDVYLASRQERPVQRLKHVELVRRTERRRGAGIDAVHRLARAAADLGHEQVHLRGDRAQDGIDPGPAGGDWADDGRADPQPADQATAVDGEHDL